MTQSYVTPTLTHATWTVSTPGECPVFVLGAARDLGEWRADRALPMHMHHVGRHLVDWTIELTFERGQSVEFKFIEKTATGEVRWEEGANRVFHAEQPESTTHWGAFRQRRSASMLHAA